MNFADLAETLSKLDGVPSRVARACADEISEEIRAQFDAGTDPYGKPWEPLKASTIKRKGGDTRILIRGGDLADETEARPSSGAGIEISSVSYGQVHQFGQPGRMVARPILPYGDELPERWGTIIQKATDDEFAKVLR